MRLPGTWFWMRLLQLAAAANSSAKLSKPVNGAGRAGGLVKSALRASDINGAKSTICPSLFKHCTPELPLKFSRNKVSAGVRCSKAISSTGLRNEIFCCARSSAKSASATSFFLICLFTSFAQFVNSWERPEFIEEWARSIP